MQQPRLVASDVDGTLLPPHPKPTERTITAVANVLASGTPFVLVTGRPPRWIPPIARYLPGVKTAVCANGAVLYDIAEDRVLSAITLKPEQLRELSAIAERAVPGSWLAVEWVGERADDEISIPRIETGRRPNWTDAYREVPRAQMAESPAIKLLIRHDELNSDQIFAALAPHVGEDVSLTWSDPSGMIEAAAAGVTKATGLAEVAAAAGVDQADVIAFGDMPNDLEMLQWVGHGVAMGNAHPAILAVADEVTAPNTQDGVALVLERWF
ncbi:Cof-type HAD-IIB family hydrolase [Pseudonocardia spinosispora]|uniref:Cof-type HAD-IIB family hydrolase n=1 Tax=Pseudonocardia spinosispora TaxID=103441 RepID=UPI0004090909|nr:Cof-type HAD-IIB family hydrolase [Pseudonocardia spinosispora]